MIDASTRRGLATIAVLAAMAMVVLDAGMTNVALPTIAQSLNIAPATSIIVASAYQLALVIGLLPVAHVAERCGGRRLFLAGVMLFTFASAFAAFAPAFPMLVAARFLQGLGGAAILALGIALLRSTLGTERLGSAIAWNALNVAMCAAAGPTVGALVLTVTDWRWLYLVNLPIGILAAAASLALPKTARNGAPIDWISMGLYAAGAATLFLTFDSITKRPAVACLHAGAAAIAFALLIGRERPKTAPLIPLDLLGVRPFRLAVGASIACFVSQSAGLLALPFYLHNELSRDMLSTGLILACWPLAVALTSPWANRLAGRFEASVLCASGAAILAMSLIAAAVVPVRTSVVPLALCAMGCGVGFGLFQIPNNRNLFLAASPERSAAAGGVQGTARLTGQTLGAILVSLLFASLPGAAGPRLALAIGGACALSAALFSARRAASVASSPQPCRI